MASAIGRSWPLLLVVSIVVFEVVTNFSTRGASTQKPLCKSASSPSVHRNSTVAGPNHTGVPGPSRNLTELRHVQRANVSLAPTAEPISNVNVTFYALVADLVVNNVGPLSGAFNVDEMKDLAADQAAAFFGAGGTSAASSVLPCSAEASGRWRIGHRRIPVTKPPSCFATWQDGLLTVRTYTSIALSKLAHDAELNEMHAALQEAVVVAERLENRCDALRAATTAMDTFRIATVKVISAHIHHAVTSIQTLFDGFSSSMERVDDLSNAFVSAARSKKKSQSGGATNEVPAAAPRRLAEMLNDRITTTVRTVFSTDEKPYQEQNPVEGKFWNMLRSEISCTHTERLCELPEGCRYICNRDYFLRSGKRGSRGRRGCGDVARGDRASGNFVDTASVLHAVFSNEGEQRWKRNTTEVVPRVQLVSLGSNNDFEWEDYMTRLVEQAGAQLKQVATFDCTLNKGVKPSETMKKLGDRFKFYPYCIGVANRSLDVFRQKGRDDDDVKANIVSLAELDSLLKTGNTIELNSTASAGSRVSVLKMDIESFEFIAVPRWLQVELALVGQALQKNESNESSFSAPNRPLVSFSSLPLITVEQLQTEIHRRGHRSKKGSKFAGATWMQWLLLGYNALGFLPFATEKNHIDNCCFEAAYVHYRYFIASETWLAASYSSR